MTLFLSFFAFSQLICGLFVELFGQKKVLLWGISIHIISCVIAILANNIEWLIFARVLQVIGGITYYYFITSASTGDLFKCN